MNINNFNNERGLSSFNKLANNKSNLKRIKFWEINAQNRVNFPIKKLIDFLAQEGYCRYYIDKNNYHLMRKINNVVKEANSASIKEHLITELAKHQNKKILNAFYEQADILVRDSKLELLPSLNEQQFRDTRSESFHFFRDSVTIVTKDNIQKFALEEFKADGFITEKRIIDHDFTVTNETAVYETFLRNTMGKNEEKFLSLQSVIGYLLHREHDPANTVAIILTDEQLNTKGEANGGTGKSLLVQAINKLARIAQEDGKNFKANKSFAFQQVDFETDIICVNDASEDFNLESFYSILTDGLTVEKKYKSAFRISPEQLPKMLITTNYVVTGGKSHHNEQ